MKTTSEVNTNTVEITRRSRVAWGWSLDSSTSPEYIGTPRMVLDMIADERSFQSVLSGGVWYTSQWYVYSGSEWIPVSIDAGKLNDLFVREGLRFLYDSITATVEQ